MEIVVFWEDGFPSIDTRPVALDALRAAFATGQSLRLLSADDLPAALEAQPDLLVTPYGSAFPKSAWPAFTAYLRRGGNWVNLGGAPVTRPVRKQPPTEARGERREARGAADTAPSTQHSAPSTLPSSLAGSDLRHSVLVPLPSHRLAGGAPRHSSVPWHVEEPQSAYGKELFINQAFPIDLPPDVSLRCPPLDIDLETHFHLFQPARAWSLQVRFTTTRDFPDELGSSGPRDAILRPLVLAERDGRTLAAPIVAIDRLLGDFAGGRWVFALCEGTLPLPSDLIGRLCDYATRPRVLLDVRPSFACYYPGEMACVTVRALASRPADSSTDLKINLRVYARDTQKEVYAHLFRARSGAGPAAVQTAPFPAPGPGLYIVRASVEAGGRSKPIGFAETGFWVYDRDLIAAGKPLSVDRDYFLRDGRPYPITGTTYMAGDAHRKFLFEPNPAVWDADFAAMARAGVNMVRTGLWTGWKRAMLDPGAVDEGVLRALAAFLLTARRYDLPVIFTFFSFLPEAWGGENPYLDPKAIAAQSAFVSAFARRFANVNDLLWDLINEPSFCSPARVWSTRPNYDRFEREAWRRWLADQGVSDDEWRERWRLTPNDPLDLPAMADFRDMHIFQGTHPTRVLDYRRFAQEMFTRWAARMAQVVRENGNPNQLITVGQDEGGTGERPNPHFHGPAVDFTCNHSWWQNDDLLWDSVITKTPDRPNLIEETGIMFAEGVDGRYWRTPEEARNLFERKMALSFAGGCAGFIQWQWNTNVYMDSDNEAAIGFLRADGSEKPELEAFRGIARFFAANAHRMVGRRPEEVCVVIPHSNMFSVRDQATAATRRAVRVLEYNLGLRCRAVSEYRAEEVGDAKLIVLPSPRVLTEACWQTLLKKVEAGATLLVTGFIEADEYGRPVPRLKPFGLETRPVPVARDEPYNIHGDMKNRHAYFAGDKVQKVERALTDDKEFPDSRIMEHGEGKIYYCSLPMELSDDPWATVFLYQAVDNLCGKRRSNNPIGLPRCRIEFGDSTLYVILNETSENTALSWQQVAVRIRAGRIALAFVDRTSGEVVAKYEAE